MVSSLPTRPPAAVRRPGLRRGEARPAARHRAQHVRRDGDQRCGRRSGARAAQARRREAEADWSPERHREISGEEVTELLPALAAREPSGGYLFYDCQTDDVRLVLTVLGEAERFGAVCANRPRGRRVAATTAGAGVIRARPERRAARRHAGNVINATGVWADRSVPRSSTTRPRCRGSRRAAART